MIDLSKYFDVRELDLAWLACDEIKYTHDDNNEPVIYATGVAQKIAEYKGISELDKKIVLASAKSLGEFMHQGPVVIRPGLILSNALIDTELNFNIQDYHQPFEVIAVEIPNEILGSHGPALAFVYQPCPLELIVWIRSRLTTATYNVHIGSDRATVEDRIADLEWTETMEEGKFFHQVCRVAINVCLLAATRQTKMADFPDKILKKREHRDPHVRKLNARCCQEIVFRDLVVYDRVKTDSDGAKTGITYGPQRRRGHWKRVTYGPRHSLHRLMWIGDYWTHRSLKFGEEQPTIILK